MPMFYLGSTTVAKFNNGYKGSVSSKQYAAIWKSELRANPSLFKSVIVSLHPTRELAFLKEESLQKLLNVVLNPMYINKSFANGKFTLKQHSAYTRNKFKERIPWNKGRTGIYSETTRQKMGPKKGSPGHKPSAATLEKLSVPNPKKANLAERNGMYGKTHSSEVCDMLGKAASARFKGKSYVELYGEEKAAELKKKRSESTREARRLRSATN